MYSQSELKNLVNKAIVNLSFIPEAERLISPVKYILSIGGKRLRPVLALMSCNLFRDKIDEAILPATGIEIFHNFTLVHDDIMDNATVRRGLQTIHLKWNINQAILSGDVMAFIANECFLHTGSEKIHKALKVYNKAAIEVCIGQQLDMDFEKKVMISQEEYLRMIELKTAVLLAASARVGAIIGDADEKNTELMHEFGRNIGLAFQIQDDLLDVYGDTKVFGKISGGDIVTNKKTFLLVKALETATGNTLSTLHELLGGRQIEPEEKIKAVKGIYDQLDIKTFTEEMVHSYITKSLVLLDRVNVDPDRKDELYLLVRSQVDRDK